MRRDLTVLTGEGREGGRSSPGNDERDQAEYQGDAERSHYGATACHDRGNSRRFGVFVSRHTSEPSAAIV